jgi:hypothetical protein
MTLRSRIEQLEQLMGMEHDGGPADNRLCWMPHEGPPAVMPSDINEATAQLLNEIAAMDASVPPCP